MAEDPTARQGEATTEPNKQGLTRGEMLTAGSIAVGGLVGAMIGVPVAGMALSPAFEKRSFAETAIGAVDEFPEGEFRKVVIEPNPEAPDAYVQKRVAFVRRNAESFIDPLTGEHERYTIVSNRCVHLGCPVTESGGSFVCPCHGGAYDGNGAVVGGPPVRPLDRFGWVEKNGTLYVNEEYSVTNDGKRVPLAGPGQHTSGPQALFYPVQPGFGRS